MSVELKKERHFEIIGRTFFRDDSTALVLKQSYYFYSCNYTFLQVKNAKTSENNYTYTYIHCIASAKKRSRAFYHLLRWLFVVCSFSFAFSFLILSVATMLTSCSATSSLILSSSSDITSSFDAIIISYSLSLVFVFRGSLLSLLVVLVKEVLAVAEMRESLSFLLEDNFANEALHALLLPLKHSKSSNFVHF
jgi:hypothetical protein